MRLRVTALPLRLARGLTLGVRREELSAPIDAGIRRVKDGIKLNAELVLTGRGGAPRLECMVHGSTPADGPERRR